MSAGPFELRLTRVGFDSVEFLATLPDGTQRSVVVRVGSGSSWRTAVRFPSWGRDVEQTLGDHALDEQVRARAAEELVRLEAAMHAIRGRRTA